MKAARQTCHRTTIFQFLREESWFSTAESARFSIFRFFVRDLFLDSFVFVSLEITGWIRIPIDPSAEANDTYLLR